MAVLFATQLPYRACQLCAHGRDVQGQRMCSCPAAVAPAKLAPVDDVRRPHGACGPEAEHLDFPGLRG